MECYTFFALTPQAITVILKFVIQNKRYNKASASHLQYCFVNVTTAMVFCVLM